MNISSLFNVNAKDIRDTAIKVGTLSAKGNGQFDTILGQALDTLNTTNQYIQESDEQKMLFAMGLVDNTHDMTIAAGKADTALQYTVVVRDKLLEAYRELMQIQI
ncbi:MAG: flagellar hook-basal body complex protein FliE [Lachnospiraceae bacterium]|jgi:flagellar hook-basal body complex protein FliE|nr:flagellar hook-basal body complex protein FliE [Lachnospiraceae bacterium]